MTTETTTTTPTEGANWREMYETTNSFDFWGNYAAVYAAVAVKEGFAVIEEITEGTAKVRVTKEGFSRRCWAARGPCGPTAAEVGAVGYCPAEWVE